MSDIIRKLGTEEVTKKDLSDFKINFLTAYEGEIVGNNPPFNIPAEIQRELEGEEHMNMPHHQPIVDLYSLVFEENVDNWHST